LKTKDANNYHKTLTWLEGHRFYLTSERREIINKELARITSSPRAASEIRLETSIFVVDPAMNDTDYSPESELGTGTDS